MRPICTRLLIVQRYDMHPTWIELIFRAREVWQWAGKAFVGRWVPCAWDSATIAQRAIEKFSETRMCLLDRPAMLKHEVLNVHASIQDWPE